MTAGMRHASPETDRTLSEVLIHHNVGIKDFVGKTVLDLGCGFSDLGTDLENYGTDTTVIGLDCSPLQFDIERNNGNSTRRVIADIGKPLPLANESVDIAMATYSLPFWAQTTEEIESFYDEIQRVTKIGGMVTVYPVTVARSPFKLETYWKQCVSRSVMGAEMIKGSSYWQPLTDNFRYLQAIKLG